MNKITVIQLLNKISNGEEIPKKIKYNNQIWYWNAQTKEYIATCTICEYRLIPELGQLNDEVEIIEEARKIPEKMDRELNCDDDTVRGLVASVNEIYKEIADKYNEIIDYLESKEKGE